MQPGLPAVPPMHPRHFHAALRQSPSPALSHRRQRGQRHKVARAAGPWHRLCRAGGRARPRRDRNRIQAADEPLGRGHGGADGDLARRCFCAGAPCDALRSLRPRRSACPPPCASRRRSSLLTPTWASGPGSFHCRASQPAIHSAPLTPAAAARLTAPPSTPPAPAIPRPDPRAPPPPGSPSAW